MPSSTESLSDALGVVLAGGRSRRMGEDKAGIVIDGETLVERAAKMLVGICSSSVVADNGRNLHPDLESVVDGPGRGPAAGILGAATRHPDRTLLVLACDLPVVPAALLAGIALLGGDWVVPRWQGRLEPLCALYRPAALAVIGRRALAGQFALHALDQTELSAHYVEGEALERHGDPAAMFSNLNRPEDLRRFLRSRAV